MPPLVLTVNHIFAQCIEDLDAQGVSGNLADLARLFLEKETVRFSLDELTGPRCHTIKNSRIPALMVPVEHRQAVAGILEKIRALT